MTRRQKSTLVKRICREHGLNVKIELGRGTAYHWISIKTDKIVPTAIQDQVESRLSRDGLCGTYYSDCGPGSEIPNLCVSWSVGVY